MKHLFRLGLQFFADGDAGDDGTNNGAGNQGDLGKEGNSQNGDQNQNLDNNKKSFTDAELRSMMAKEKSEGRNSILKELGIEDTKNAKESIAEYKKWVDSQKTDLQKAQDDNKALTTRATEAEAKANALEQKFTALELGAKMESVEDIIALASAKITAEKDFKTVVNELKTKYPSFFTEGASGTGSGVSGKNNGSFNSTGLGARLGAVSKPAKSSYFN